MREKKEYVDTSFSDFFGSKVTIAEPTRIRAYFGAFFGLIALCVFGGALIAVPALATLSGVSQASEPVVDYWKSLPDELPEISISERNYLYDKNGEVFAELWSEDRIEVNSLDNISQHAIDALIATEDQRFYEHNGFDFNGTMRAFLSGSGGGSGITQQLIKNLQFYNALGTEESKQSAVESSYTRKVKELKIALAYEEKYSKDEILLQYFNTVAFGTPNTYGIETASRHLFGKSAKDLTIAESAALVGSVQNTSLYNMSDADNTEWKNRQTTVLNRMLSEGKITQEEYDSALAEELAFSTPATRSRGNCYSSKNPLYCEYVVKTFLSDPRFGETPEDRQALWNKGGFKIDTYYDPEVYGKLNEELSKLGNDNRVVAPSAVVEPGTGGVIAIAQNREWGEGEGKSTIITPNVPAGEGSTYKMFTLAAALNEGFNERTLTFNAPCVIEPSPNYDTPAGGIGNSTSCAMQSGVLDYKTATAYSSNTYFVELEKKITVEKLKEFSRSVGLAAPDSITNRSLSYTLGSVGNPPIDVAAAFATFANDGVYCPATPIKDYQYTDGTKPVYPDSYNPEDHSCRSVMSPQSASIVLKAMRANISGEVEDAFGLEGNINGYSTAAKSGTNQLFNVAWAHVSAPYSVYVNVYDMDRTVRGIDWAYYNGSARPWHYNIAKHIGSNMMRDILPLAPKENLNFNSTDNNFAETPVNEDGFFAVPNVIGMTPEEAKEVFSGLMTVEVSKEKRDVPAGYQSGVIVEQSVEPGKRASRGTSTTIILYIGE